ncbi:MAG: cytochrome c [Campylobacterota bacterium]|nr:cytochrome c [Campylobacterota bacterium]
MKKIWYLLPLVLVAKEDFISDFEYGQMLYKNPRGISCASCHGLRGEGREIVSYQDKNETIVIRGSDIRNRSLEEIESIVARNHKVMPKYYLTIEEVEAIYNYLQEINRSSSTE